jgi:two-component system, OmpR family, sensor histidine kinase VicK
VTVKVQNKYVCGEINNDNISKIVAMVSVKDTGSGIDPDIMLRLFEKFATISFQGTGLGLFISKKIIEARGGKIWGRNNISDGKGATFYFTLPIVSNQVKQLEPKQNI